MSQVLERTKRKDLLNLPKWRAKRMSTILMKLSNSFLSLAWLSGKSTAHRYIYCLITHRHARKQQTTLARSYAAIATGKRLSTTHFLTQDLHIPPELKLAKFSTYLSLRGLVRFTECCLLLWRLTAGRPEHKTQAKKVRQHSTTSPRLIKP